jgi:hypothetical protein
MKGKKIFFIFVLPFSIVVIYIILYYLIYILFYSYYIPYIPPISSFNIPPTRCDFIFWKTNQGDYYDFPRDGCFEDLAYEKDNINYCLKIKSALDIRARCIDYFAIKEKNPQLCELHEEKWARTTNIYKNCLNKVGKP